MLTVNICKIEDLQSTENESVNENHAGVYELERADQVFSSNEVAKLEIAYELRRQGVTIEAISRILSIPQEELFAEFES